MSTKTKSLPTLYRLTASGGISVYETFVRGNEIHRITYQITKKGEEGKKTKKAVLYGEVMDAGKSNERSEEEHARDKAESLWKKMKDKGYTEKKPALGTARTSLACRTPMLLYKYPDYGLHECGDLVQPKMNGVRGFYRISDKVVVSRKDKVYPFLDHLHPSLLALAEAVKAELPSLQAIDTELDVEGITVFQRKTEVLRATKRPHKDNDKVFAWVFDVADDGEMGFEERYRILERVFNAGDYPGLRLVPCYDLKSDKCLKPARGWLRRHYSPNPQPDEPIRPMTVEETQCWLDGKELPGKGYITLTPEGRLRFLHRWFTDGLELEGTVIRAKDGLYRGNDYRSQAVLKYKDFKDEEATIVDALAAKGAHAGAMIVVVKNEGGAKYKAVFGAELGLSVATRQKMYRERKKFMGRVVTIRYQEMTDDGKVQFGRVVAFRDSDLLA